MLLKRVIPFLLCLTVFAQCDNPFKTRKAEDPELKQSSWTQPVTAELVIFNLKNALAEKNSENYLRCLDVEENQSGSYSWIPEALTALNYPEAFKNWNIESERRYINQVFSLVPDDSTIALNLTDIEERLLPDSAWTVKDYALLVQHTLTGYPSLVKGRMEIGLSKTDQGLWYISFWEDRRTEDFPVWSLFKAIF